MSKQSRYRSLKAKYGTLLAERRLEKGHVRAFVGVSSWLRERERLDSGADKILAHIDAFESALSSVSRSVAGGRFHDEFKKAQKQWVESGGCLNRKGNGDILIYSPIPRTQNLKSKGRTLISLFSGAFGLDLGFLANGFEVKFANDIDKNSCETIKKNLPRAPIVSADFTTLSPSKILGEAGLDVGELDVLTGGPPCQPFSTAGRRRGLSDPRASPLMSFIKAVEEIEPKTFVMEEVTGLKSSRLVHVPISERKKRPLKENEKKGSAFKVVLDMLHQTGYKIKYAVLNAADFGAPQSRERIIFVGSRNGAPSLPTPTHTGVPQGTLTGEKLEPWNSFWESVIDLQGSEMEYVGLSPSRSKYMRIVPPGGHWRHLPEDAVKRAMGGAFESGGGKMGYFRRLSWDDPSPTVVGFPNHKGTMFCHPEDVRPMSVEEYKRVQGFPDDWQLSGNTYAKYRLVGDAVPVYLSNAVAEAVVQILEGSSATEKQNK